MIATARVFCPTCGTRSPDGGTCQRDGARLLDITPDSLLGIEIGNYVIVRALGEGGMGAVYRAVQPAIGAEVAIKVLHASSEAHAKRFLLEAQTVNRVRHEGLIKILDTGYLGDRRPYLVMELLDGLAFCDTVGKLGIKLACHVTAEALDALEAVHDVGVVHRDLKPANIFVTREGRVVVLDFGIAKIVDGSAPMTHSSALIGTPEYMAPEQIRSQPLDRRADVYAMGVLLYEAITGKRPFAAAATFEMLVQHLEHPPTSPRDYVPELPLAIADAVLRALEKDPADRFQRAADMAGALRAAIDTVGADEELAAYVDAHQPAQQRAHRTPVDEAPPTVQVRGSGSQRARTNASSSEAVTRDEGRRAPSHEKPTREDDPREDDPRVDRSERAEPARKRTWMPAFAIIMVATAAVAISLVAFRDRSRGSAPTATAPGATSPATTEQTPATADAGADASASVTTTGFVDVTTDPKGARILVDGLDVGAAPVEIEARTGTHRLRAKLGNRVSPEQTIDFREGQRLSVMIVLPAATITRSTTRVTSKPVDTAIDRDKGAFQGSATSADKKPEERGRAAGHDKGRNPHGSASQSSGPADLLPSRKADPYGR